QKNYLSGLASIFRASKMGEHIYVLD
ncbi:N-acetyltransferase, partial [Escherichia coli]|nr:N-acetyltransferase [Escherichia coli]